MTSGVLCVLCKWSEIHLSGAVMIMNVNASHIHFFLHAAVISVHLNESVRAAADSSSNSWS